jgi:hypothetical protein
MLILTAKALLAEFYERLNGDLRFVLAYLTANVEDGDGLAAVAVLRSHGQHSEKAAITHCWLPSRAVC